ncbi:hypothetical protein OH805_38515 [Streptomyces sp. NBC_00879]|uniref:hypothetical protein n=1 Tax=Streptomyces sp. NBC_00879 TaxID=2975855 RepID=UPI003864447E|nr:hypothetical protein OH805_00065 [Streptomyces sp. NBC_00879]WSY79538.1 hypothetical protein OH805_38515 [Streptomyces sp. NBC_00879]
MTSATDRIAALTRDAGTTQDIEDRTALLRTDTPSPASPSPSPSPNSPCASTTPPWAPTTQTAPITRLNNLTRSGDHAYYAGIAHSTAGLPLDAPPPARTSTVARRRTAGPRAMAESGRHPARSPARHPMTHRGSAGSGGARSSTAIRR